MLRTMMTSKIHRATVTQADLLPGELVHIVDVTNGAWLETYTIAGERGSGVLGINGAAARLVHPRRPPPLVSRPCPAPACPVG